MEKTIRLIDTSAPGLAYTAIVVDRAIDAHYVLRRHGAVLLQRPNAMGLRLHHYVYGTLFMLVGAYALAQNNHVRGDVFYRFFPVRCRRT